MADGPRLQSDDAPDVGLADGRPKLTMTIPPEWAGWSLFDTVRALAELDQAPAMALIARGGAWLDRRRALGSTQLVLEGPTLTLHFPPVTMQPAVVTQADVLYEDAALLVLNKPPGMYVTMTPWDIEDNVLWAARQFLTARDGIPPILHLAHQLDRDTSGVLILSKDPRANAPLQVAFGERTTRKRYLALVD